MDTNDELKQKTKGKIFLGATTFLSTAIILASALFGLTGKENNNLENVFKGELARSMTYKQVEEGDENVEGTNEHVKFDAFFLRDLDGDGYAESIRGTAKEIGKQDTLYMELNVLTEGYLKDAKIEIDGKNFYYQTALVKDPYLKANYIGNDIKTIEFNELQNGTQKFIMGSVKSGDYTYNSDKKAAIKDSTKNYSRDDSRIILTGTYVDINENEIEIRKEVPLTVDWYGRTSAGLKIPSKTYEDLDRRINEEEGTITLDFTVSTIEYLEELLLKSNVLKGVIPELSGYAPVSVTSTMGNENFVYDETSRTFTITRESRINGEGVITSKLSAANTYGIRVVYPLESFQALGTDSVTIRVPVQTYYEGYNNPNREFDNPFKSNTATGVVVATYKKYEPREVVPGTIRVYSPSLGVTVGKQVYSPTRRIVSKEKPISIYNEKVEETKDDLYKVLWTVYTGTNGATSGIELKEGKIENAQNVDKFVKADEELDSMEEITTNKGIYFEGASQVLKEDGFIKVYDAETDELLVTFTKDNWDKYNEQNPYKYEVNVNHIKVVTSDTIAEKSLLVYNIKELNDEKIVDTYTREEFDNLKYIRSYVEGKIGEVNLGLKNNQALYEEDYSKALIALSKNVLSTQ